MARNLEFSSPSYARFSKMCLVGRGHFDMSKIPRGESKFELQDRGTLDMSSGACGHVEMDLG